MNTNTQTCQNPKNRKDARTKEPGARVKPMLPTIKAVAAELSWEKRFICDDCRASEEDTLPSIQVTLATDCTDRTSWAIQTGDNSYTGVAYGYRYWGVSALCRRSNCRELAKELIEQIAEQWWQGQ